MWWALPALVQLNETLAHQRIQGAFRRFSKVITSHDGVAHEIRGDALVAEFARVSDAVAASCPTGRMGLRMARSF
jgi:class 3 adenylate cyclase